MFLLFALTICTSDIKSFASKGCKVLYRKVKYIILTSIFRFYPAPFEFRNFTSQFFAPCYPLSLPHL